MMILQIGSTINMKKKQASKSTNPVIVVAIIGLIGSITSAVLSSPVLLAKIQNAPAPTITASIPAFTILAPTNTLPVLTSTQTSIPTDTSSQILHIPSMGDTIPVTGKKLGDIIEYDTYWKYSHYIAQMPDDINPIVSPNESLDKTIVSIKTGDVDEWLPVSSGLQLILNMQNVQGDDGLDIKVIKEATVAIIDFTPSNSHVNVLYSQHDGAFLIPVTGGGSYDYFLSPVPLDSLNWNNVVYSTTLEEYDSVILEPGEIGSFQLELYCKNPGIYRVVVTVQIFYSGEFHDLFFDPPVKLNCPSSLTLWEYQSLSDDGSVNYEWKKQYDLFLQNGEYISLPMDDMTATPDQ